MQSEVWYAFGTTAELRLIDRSEELLADAQETFEEGSADDQAGPADATAPVLRTSFSTRAHLLNHLIRPEPERRRDCEAERLDA